MLQSNVAEKGTQTYITGDSLSKLMPPETVSTSSQTDAIDDVDISGVVDDYKNDVDFEKIDIPQLHAEINDNITVESENSKSPQQLEATNHNISWPTAPLLNCLPALNLLMASSILGTGMDSNKTLRFMESHEYHMF